MGLAVAMALSLLAVAVVLAVFVGIAWGIARVTRMAFVAARDVLRPG